ncbi:HK97-gp10 family putative phage morphogenesis protein [Hymenobacter aerilatus]|uniref:HK97-gp10 family putative phage morphogenesis protein n=1 Tax=Hymenobacter aerilatus TaxID=2932251 RepID=UPI0035CB0367
MASNLQVGVDGQQLNGLLNKIKLLLPSTRAAAREVVAETLLLIESDAKELAPVDTGRLRSSIHTEISSNGLSGVVGTNVSYAPFVELGTTRQRAQPFLFPAYEANRQRFLDNLKSRANLK